MDYTPTMTKKELIDNVDNMTIKEIYIETKKQLIQEMIVELETLEKRSYKDYYLIDEEWETSEGCKSFLDTIFNDVKTLKELIEINKSDLKELTK